MFDSTGAVSRLRTLRHLALRLFHSSPIACRRRRSLLAGAEFDSGGDLTSALPTASGVATASSVGLASTGARPAPDFRSLAALLDTLTLQSQAPTAAKPRTQRSTRSSARGTRPNPSHTANGNSHNHTLTVRLSQSLHANLDAHLGASLAQLQPSRASHVRVSGALKDLAAIIRRQWPEAFVAAHGSFASGLNLVGSDVDVAIFLKHAGHTSEAKRERRKLASRARFPLSSMEEIPMERFEDVTSGESYAIFPSLLALLRRQPHYHRIEFFGRARVPIIRLYDSLNNVHFDLCLNQRNCADGVRFTRQYREQFGDTLRDLILILKQFLQTRALNEKFTGGLSSFTLTCMACHFLKHSHARAAQSHDTAPLARSVLGFLDYFGTQHDYRHDTLCLRRGSIPRQHASTSLSFVHPFNELDDVGGGSSRFREIRREFAAAAGMWREIASKFPYASDAERDRLVMAFVNCVLHNRLCDATVDESLHRQRQLQQQLEDDWHFDQFDLQPSTPSLRRSSRKATGVRLAVEAVPQPVLPRSTVPRVDRHRVSRARLEWPSSESIAAMH